MTGQLLPKFNNSSFLYIYLRVALHFDSFISPILEKTAELLRHSNPLLLLDNFLIDKKRKLEVFRVFHQDEENTMNRGCKQRGSFKGS